VFSEAGNIPQIGYKERSSQLGDSRAYPNHLRTVPAYYMDGIVTVDLIKDYFEWDKVTLFSTTDEYGSKTSFLFKDEAEKRGVEILSSHAFLVDTKDLSNEINAAKKQGSFIFVLLMSASDAFNLLEQGFELGLFNKNTQIIGGGHLSTADEWEAGGIPDHKVAPYMSGFMGVHWLPKVFPSGQVTSFIQRWKARPSTAGTVQPDSSILCDDRSDYYNDFKLHQFQPYDNASLAPVCAGVNFSSYGNDGSDLIEEMYAYDAVMAVVHSLHYIAYEEGVCDPPASRVRDYLLHDLAFYGLTGNVSFSTRNEHQHFDIGGRDSSYVYQVVNYRPGSTASDGMGSIRFQPVVNWHSEVGFDLCDGQMAFNRDCHDILFATKDNSKPFDSPPPDVVEMHVYYQTVLMLLAVGSLLLLLVFTVVIVAFRKRRIVKMAQPNMILLICSGLMMMCVRVILSAGHLTVESCTGEFWTAHMGFILVMTSFGVKTWRVHMVTNAMKKVKISEAKCLVIVGVFASVASIVMIIHNVIGQIHVSEVTLIQDQFEHVKEVKCLYANYDALMALHALEIVSILFAARMLWVTRKVASTISSTATTATGKPCHVMSCHVMSCHVIP
jgi:mannose/fructose/N-acetylgalactosamine-specific phosphotransferase system component IIB